MIFLIPLLIIFGIIFGIDYVYFKEENEKLKEQKEQCIKLDKNTSKEQYLNTLFKS